MTRKTRTSSPLVSGIPHFPLPAPACQHSTEKEAATAHNAAVMHWGHPGSWLNDITGKGNADEYECLRPLFTFHACWTQRFCVKLGVCDQQGFQFRKRNGCGCCARDDTGDGC